MRRRGTMIFGKNPRFAIIHPERSPALIGVAEKQIASIVGTKNSRARGVVVRRRDIRQG